MLLPLGARFRPKPEWHCPVLSATSITTTRWCRASPFRRPAAFPACSWVRSNYYPRDFFRPQQHRVHLERHPGLGTGSRRRVALHRAGQTYAEWLRGELQRAPAGSASMSTYSPTSRRHGRSSKNGGSTTTPTDRTRASTGSHRLSSQHAPIRGITGTDSIYEWGQVGEQVRASRTSTSTIVA